MCVKDVVQYPYVIIGGGAPEAFVSQRIRNWANTLSGREQLAAEKYADGLESLPLVLAENAGMDMIDTQVQLRSKQVDIEKPIFGIDVKGAQIADLSNKEIYEPLLVKEHVINSATEAACMILRIDDVIAASKPKESGNPSAGHGHNGMPGMDM